MAIKNHADKNKVTYLFQYNNQNSVMHCPHCNETNPDTAKFCKNCGQALGSGAISICESFLTNHKSGILIVLGGVLLIGGGLLFQNNRSGSVADHSSEMLGVTNQEQVSGVDFNGGPVNTEPVKAGDNGLPKVNLSACRKIANSGWEVSYVCPANAVSEFGPYDLYFNPDSQCTVSYDRRGLSFDVRETHVVTRRGEMYVIVTGQTPINNAYKTGEISRISSSQDDLTISVMFENEKAVYAECSWALGTYDDHPMCYNCQELSNF